MKNSLRIRSVPIFGRVTPSPPRVEWNHRLSGKTRAKYWGSVTYGQNIDIKELSLGHRARATLARVRIIKHFGCGAQGQMSQEAVDFCASEWQEWRKK
jgi:hypothetical protein